MERRLALVLFSAAFFAAPARAGVTNPNISVIGQPFMRWHDDASDPSHERATLDPGEVEGVFDAYLNPYASGTFVLTFGEDGAALEEGYFQLLRGLPAGLALKGGKYRMDFGKLNPQHPHAYPFATRWRVLSSYLPGEESLNETAVELSGRIPAPGDFSLTASADWMNGDTFRVAREPGGSPDDPLAQGGDDDAGSPRPAFLGRLSGFSAIGDRSGLELGLSATTGINNVAADARTSVYGADAKVKLWTADNAYLLVQGEFLRQDLDHAGWDSTAAAYTTSRTHSNGGYIHADYNFKIRYNAGGGYERFRQPVAGGDWDQAFKLWVGLSLMEETTAFRLDWDRYLPGDTAGGSPDAINTITLRAVFSMGPHKAHQF
ncbi:MAG TPA: hypothetical protein VF247_09190 [Candidatus Krumholzibacteria bacterium]